MEGRESKGLEKGVSLKIDSSTIGMESTRRYSSSTTRSSRFTVKDYAGNSAHQTGGLFGNLVNTSTGENTETKENKDTTGDQVTNSGMTLADAMKELSNKVESMRNNLRTNMNTNSISSSMDSFKQLTMRSIFMLLFGEETGKSIFSQDFTDAASQNSFSLQEQQSNTLVLQSESFYEESEYTSFSTTGNVKTADGREININVEVNMSRRFTQYFSDEIQIQKINTCDPLVLNFDGAAAELSDQKFFFDLDVDGEKESISKLSSGSGYLALDKNEDGTINDGSELFGTKSGDGFKDLASYDEDHNGWIDENDSIWNKLKIWCQNEDGSSALYTLAEKGVGAVSLKNADTEFSINNEKNDTNGIIRKTGIFLYENGNVGTLQHLDIAN